MVAVAFFGHNAGDAAVRRRVVAFQRAGAEVLGLMMRRADEPPAALPWRNVDLGRTADARYAQRLLRIVVGAWIAAKRRAELRAASVLYARNLDMLLCAALARMLGRVRTPLVYECLDIHALLTRSDAVGRLMRALERRLIRQTALIVISSPAFEREHFAVRHPGVGRFFLAENRLIAGDAFPPRPQAAPSRAGPLRLGWFGNLRCPVSIGVLEAVKDRCGDAVEIVLRGYFTEQTEPMAQARLIATGKASYGGRYQAPQDLAELYGGVDVVWAGDYFEAGFNSVWLLPNRIYEGGYFAVPAIAPEGTETARWIEARSAGFAVADPPERSVPELIAALIADRQPLERARRGLLALPASTFVEPPDDARRLLAAALGDAAP